MNANDQDFVFSDSWLSEQFNSHLVNDIFQAYPPNPDIGGELSMDMHAYELTTPRLESTFKRNTPIVGCYDIKSEILDLSYRTTDTPLLPFELAGSSVPMDFSPPALDLATSANQAPAPTLSEVMDGTVAKTTTQNNIYSFDSIEEEMQLLRFLEDKPKSTPIVDPSIFMPIQLPSTTVYGIFKCAKCNYLFDTMTFQSHVCEAQKVSEPTAPPKPIPSETTPNISSPQLSTLPLTTPSASTPPPVDVVKPIKCEPLLPSQPACIRLLKENQIRIRRFLKDELKYDVYAAGGGNSNFKNNNTITNNNSSSPNESSCTDILNISSTSTVSNSGSLKKQEGPHECSLCERKFVHASGLLRHMEKHAMDLIPTSNSNTVGKCTASQGNSALHNVNGLRVVIKCTLCGRIFFDQDTAFSHMCSHFPSTWMDEKEMDNDADIPYESYMDDAIQFLKVETNDASSSCAIKNAITNYQEQKTPLYLKMVILTCILQCEFCDFVFSDVSYLFVHSSCHIPERRFECFSCEIFVRTSKEICSHWQAECVFMRENTKVNQAITQRYFVCNVCENKFQSLDLLHEHRYTSYHFFPRLNLRLGILQLPCEYCDLVFENAQDCVTHYEDKHYRKNRRLDKDGSVYSSKTRQYLCDICGKSYTQSSHLWQHLRFHQGVKPFACKEPGCTRKFTIRPDLNDHIRKCHTGERPYHCLVCGKRFLTGSVFYQHRLIHRGERRYECEECGKRFYRADALKNHQRIHTGEKPFGCLFCTKNFRQRGDRDKHMRARHKHLDDKARIMMQMQKLQLEAAATAVAAQGEKQQCQPPIMAIPNNTQTASCSYAPSPPINNENVPASSYAFMHDGIGDGGISNDNNDIVMIGNVAFPKTMIESLIMDIDEESFLKTMQQQNTLNFS